MLKHFSGSWPKSLMIILPYNDMSSMKGNKTSVYRSYLPWKSLSICCMIISSIQCTVNWIIIINFLISQVIHEPFLEFQKTSSWIRQKKKKKKKEPSPQWDDESEFFSVAVSTKVHLKSNEDWHWCRKGHDEHETICWIYMLRLFVSFGNFTEDYLKNP